jgi:cellulose synthase/poly-beta-1,6-N-acetylglucosamine synthase-like glycosyltransferase
VRAIHVPQGGLPAGWLGKCHALWTAAKQADSEWILFVDSDVKLEPDALSGVLALAVNRQYDAVSIMTRLECETFLERLVLPLAAASVSAMCLVSLTNDDNRQIAFANGQFFLIRRAAYEAVGGHESVKDHITEDVALMRIIKRRGFRTRLYMGRQFASTRMHSTYPQMLNGWGRIYSGVSSRRPWRILGAMGYVLSGLLAYIALLTGIAQHDQKLLLLAALHWLLMTGVVATFYHWSGNRKRYALLFPLAAPVLLSLYAYALKMCRTGQVAWRGTSYTYNATPAAK